MPGGITIDILDDFDKITDLAQAINLLKSWGVPTAGIKGLEGAVELLIEHWLDENPQENNVKTMLHPDEQGRIRHGLVEKCQDTEKHFKDLPQKLKGSILKAFPEFLEALRSRQEELCSGESTIIVAGEVGAGKSSLINLLLEEDLLPTEQLKCTNTICEIRNSRNGKKEAIAYLRGGSDEGRGGGLNNEKIINLEEERGIQELRHCITCANEYDDSPYEKVKIYWPMNVADGIVIVDTPGVQGGSNVDMILRPYLSKAFGIIYVINTNAAGGVQHSRLGALLKTVVNAAEDFSPEASLFIGNKWENIPVKDKEAVKEDIHRKLNKVYPGVTEEQIHYMSVIKSRKIFKRHNQKREEHKDVLIKIEQLTYDNLRKGMTSNYTWLSSFLNKSLHLIRVANQKDSLSKDELQEECEKLKRQIKQLQKDTDKSIVELRRKTEYTIYKITQEITSLLPSRAMMDSLCDWTGDACAKNNKKWKVVAEEASCLISKRIQKAIDDWEKKNDVLRSINEDIVEVFAKEFGLMEHHIKELEESMYKGRQLSTTVITVPVKAIFKRKIKQIEKTYWTLGGAVSCVGGLDTSKKSVRQAFKDYEKDKAGTMSKATVLYIETILQQKDLQGKLLKFFNRYFVDIDTAAKRIPGFLQADQQMIDTVSQRLDENIAVSQKYPVLHDDCKTILSKLDTFYVNYIMKFDYQYSDIICDYSQKSLIGSGAFAHVYRGKLRTSDHEVALKVADDVIKQSNVTDILTEDRIMRELSHKNIIHYYGASYERKPKGIIWFMVMELCRTSLKGFYITERKAKIPGQFPDGHPARSDAVHQMVSYAVQICEGLAYIHEKEFTHRDLKMENILLDMSGMIKLTDVGVAKPTNLLSMTLKGSPAYMAPEVLLSSRNQSNKIDIYSLSYILWEMWYGLDLAEEIDKEVLGNGFCGDAMSKFKVRQSESDGGFRPSLTKANKPPQDFMNVLRRSWATDPDARPTADELVTFFRDFLHNRE